MSYGIQAKKLKKLVDYYSPFNNAEELKCLSMLKGDEGLLRYLQTSPFQGIDSTSIEERVAWFGSNEHAKLNKQSVWCATLMRPFQSLTMKLALIFSIFQLILGIVTQFNSLKYPWLEGVVNLLGFLLVYILLLIPEIFQNKDNEKIKQYSFQTLKCHVWRDNEKVEIYNTSLVVGDVVELSPGNIIGADGLMIEGEVIVRQKLSSYEITIPKCPVKYCSESQKKMANKLKSAQDLSKPSPIVLGGSEVLSGQGRMAVICVGQFSRIGYFSSLVYRSAIQKPSTDEIKIASLMFEISKSMVLILIIKIILIVGKNVIIFFVKNAKFNWIEKGAEVGLGMSGILWGLPMYAVIGLTMGIAYIKIKIYKEDGIIFKYGKDCIKMKDVSTIGYEKSETETKIQFMKWWNVTEEIIKSGEQSSQSFGSESCMKKFELMFIESLKCVDFKPCQISFNFPSFYIGLNEKDINSLNEAFYNFADSRKEKIASETSLQSYIDLESQENEGEKQKQIIYFKGIAETLLKQCTHIMIKKTGKIEPIDSARRQQIQGLIWKENASQLSSAITGYIEVNPNHPRFREPGYKVVFLSLIHFKQNYNHEEFQALSRIRKIGKNVILLSSKEEHSETVTAAKELGIIIFGKPSVQLRGYDITRIVGGIICKFCKKSMCVCSEEGKFEARLKNQDEFVRIHRHLHVVSQIDSIDKFVLVTGFKNMDQGICVISSRLDDIPSMRAANISIGVQGKIQDDYARAAVEVILPNSKLSLFQKLINWSNFTGAFYKKYIVFFITPCISGFIISSLTMIMFDEPVLNTLHFAWIAFVICPLLSLTFVLSNHADHTLHLPNQNCQKDSILSKSMSRHLTSQIFLQVCLILVITFFGQKFIPQSADIVDVIIGDHWEAKYSDGNKSLIRWGVKTNIFQFGKEVYKPVFARYGIHSRQLTIIFNLFVLLQIFNFFNCRKILERSLNLLEDFNIQSVFIILLALCLQIIVVTFGDAAWGLYPSGLTFKQWIVCIGLSISVFIVGLIVKQIPDDEEKDESKYRQWPNRSYNLAVMSVVPRETLLDFEIEQQFQMKNPIISSEP